jgi:hypothetical protein
VLPLAVAVRVVIVEVPPIFNVALVPLWVNVPVPVKFPTINVPLLVNVPVPLTVKLPESVAIDVASIVKKFPVPRVSTPATLNAPVFALKLDPVPKTLTAALAVNPAVVVRFAWPLMPLAATTFNTPAVVNGINAVRDAPFAIVKPKKVVEGEPVLDIVWGDEPLNVAVPLVKPILPLFIRLPLKVGLPVATKPFVDVFVTVTSLLKVAFIPDSVCVAVPLKVTGAFAVKFPVAVNVCAAVPLKVTGAFAVKFPVAVKLPLMVARVAAASIANEPPAVLTLRAPFVVKGIAIVVEAVAPLIVSALNIVVAGVPPVEVIVCDVPLKVVVPAVQVIEPVFFTTTLPVMVVLPVDELVSVPLTFSAEKFATAVPVIVLDPLSVTAFTPAASVPALKVNVPVPFVIKSLFNVSVEVPAFAKFLIAVKLSSSPVVKIAAML